MKLVEELQPDHIIISNLKTSTSYKEFTKDMRSRKFTDLKLLEVSGQFKMRYLIDNLPRWYDVKVLQKRGKDYYFEILLLQVTEFEKNYIAFNRQDKLNKLLI